MNKILKRLLSVVLALLMIIGIVPVNQLSTVNAALNAPDTIYFDTSNMETLGESKWENVYITFKTWSTPDIMTKVPGHENLYKYEVKEGTSNTSDLIFTNSNNWNDINANDFYRTEVINDGGTNDYCYKVTGITSISINGANRRVYTVEKSPYNDTDIPSGDTRTIYLDTSAYLPTGWSEAYIYLYNPTTGAISGPTKMNPVSNGLYSYDVDTSKYTYVIFKPNANNWSGQTNGLLIPSDKNLYTCKTFSSVTSGTWETYSTSISGGEFPSNVTGKATFFDLYTDYEINPNVYNGKYPNQSKTSILRAFNNNVNAAISNYWKQAQGYSSYTYTAHENNNNHDVLVGNINGQIVLPLYFGVFQPFYNVSNSSDTWWTSDDNLTDYNNYTWWTQQWPSFSWLVNRASEEDGSAVVQGLVDENLDKNGNIASQGIALPQFSSEFYKNNQNIGRQYATTDFPFAVRNIDGVNYYQFDSGANNSEYRDVIRMNDDGTLSYYDGTKQSEQVVNGITSDGKKSPGFFPFNAPEDSPETKYDGADNDLNYGFGMKLEIEFTMDADGKVQSADGTHRDDAIFKFSGDDDVWVFVDDQLALDMGGDHDIASGKINFGTLENENKITANVNAVKSKDNKGEYINTENEIDTATNVTKKLDFDKNKEIHTLTIFYEERGMFESNFKATFNLEQPTKLKVTNEVNVDNVNSGLQDATALAAKNDQFSYQFTEGKNKTYTTETGIQEVVEDNGKLIINDGQSATFINQFDRTSPLSLKQDINKKYTTSWSFSEMDVNEQSVNSISASYLDGKDSCTIGDGRVEGNLNSKFLLENKQEDESIPARVLAAFVQNPKTGNISIKKVLEEGFDSDALFEFKVNFTKIFGSTAEEILNLANGSSLTYNVYDANDNLIATRVTGDDGTVKIQAGQYAVIANIPVDSTYSISEVSGVDYQVTDLTASETNNDNPSITDYIATGTVVPDAANTYDLYTFTNGEVKLQDAFLVEMDKENTLSVIPDEEVDGTLSGNLLTIKQAYDKATAENKKIGFVFVDEEGNLVVDKKDEKEFPVESYTADGVSYAVTYAENGKLSLKVTPSSDAVSGKNTLEVKYQLVELNEDGSIKYSEKTIDNGDDTPITVTTVDIVTPVIITTNYLYKANDDIYVLDYGLDVDLADRSADSGMFQNDVLENPSLNGSIITYWNTSKGISSANASARTDMDQNIKEVTGDHGKITPEADTTNGFAISNSEGNEKNPKVTYSMGEFLSDKDYYNYNVMVNRSENLDKNQTSNRFHVNLTSNVTVMPANVVYYEDNFNSDAESTDSSAKIIYSGTSALAGASLNLTQSNGQTEQYGHDDAYADGTEDSGGSSTKLTANGYDTTATFTFTGTGFDIVARTSDETAAIFCIIGKVADDGKVTLDKTITVDTYYANGDLYQIPVIHETDLEYGKYQVILGIKSSSKASVVYLDGIRIYNPLGTEGDDAYIDNEEGATITSVSDLILGDCEITETGIVDESGDVILKGQTVKGSNAALFDDMGDPDKPFYPMAYNKVEDINGDTSTNTGSVLTYLNAGPTNELYLEDGSAFVFVATEDAGVENRTIQIEAKLLKDGSDNADELLLEIMNNNMKLKEIATVNSSTAMYYEIPVDQCIKLSDGKYLVAIDGATGGLTGKQYLSFSNLKVKGYTLSNPLEDSDALSYIDTEDLEESSVFVAVDTFSVRKRRWSEWEYTVTVKAGIFEENTAAFKMYYKNAKDVLTPITVYAELKETNGDNEVYSLKFKAPNAVGQFPVLIHTYINGVESEEFISTNMTVK